MTGEDTVVIVVLVVVLLLVACVWCCVAWTGVESDKALRGITPAMRDVLVHTGVDGLQAWSVMRTYVSDVHDFADLDDADWEEMRTELCWRRARLRRFRRYIHSLTRPVGASGDT